MNNFDRCPACGVSVCLGECGMPIQDGTTHEDGEILKCDECLAEDNACPGCGDYRYDSDECPSCDELMNAIVEDSKKRRSDETAN